MYLIAQSPNQSPKVTSSRALILRWLTTTTKFEHDDKSARKGLPGIIAQGSPPLSKDHVLCSDGDVDLLLRHRFLCFRKLPFAQMHTPFLIQTDAVHPFTPHFHIRHFLFLDGSMCVRLGHVMIEFCLFFPVYCNSLLATLNVRRAIRGRGHNDLGISLRPIGDTTVGSKDARGVCARATCTLPPLIQPLA